MDDDLALWAEADAFSANAGESLKSQVHDASFARVHRIELERLTRGLHAFGSGTSHHFELFDTQGAVARAVEKDFVLPGRFEAQSAMGEMLDGLKKVRAAFQEEVLITAGEVGKNFSAAIVSG